MGKPKRNMKKILSVAAVGMGVAFATPQFVPQQTKAAINQNVPTRHFARSFPVKNRLVHNHKSSRPRGHVHHHLM